MDNDKMLPQASAIILEEQTNLTISEVCQACAVRVETILELVDEGVLLPIGQNRIAGASRAPTSGGRRWPSGCSAISVSIWPAPRWPCSYWTNLKHCTSGCAKSASNNTNQG